MNMEINNNHDTYIANIRDLENSNFTPFITFSYSFTKVIISHRNLAHYHLKHKYRTSKVCESSSNMTLKHSMKSECQQIQDIGNLIHCRMYIDQ